MTRIPCLAVASNPTVAEPVKRTAFVLLVSSLFLHFLARHSLGSTAERALERRRFRSPCSRPERDEAMSREPHRQPTSPSECSTSRSAAGNRATSESTNLCLFIDDRLNVLVPTCEICFSLSQELGGPRLLGDLFGLGTWPTKFSKALPRR